MSLYDDLGAEIERLQSTPQETRFNLVRFLKDVFGSPDPVYSPELQWALTPWGEVKFYPFKAPITGSLRFNTEGEAHAARASLYSDGGAM